MSPSKVWAVLTHVTKYAKRTLAYRVTVAYHYALYGHSPFWALDCRAFVYRGDDNDNYCWPKSVAANPEPCADCIGRNYDEQVLRFLGCVVDLKL